MIRLIFMLIFNKANIIICLVGYVLVFSIGCLDVTETLFDLEEEAPEELAVTSNRLSGRYNPLPTAVAITYPNTIDMTTVTIADFSVSDTCAGSTVSLSSVNVVGYVATVNISNTVACVNGEAFTLVAIFSGVLTTGAVASVGGTSYTYTRDTVAPTASITVGTHDNITTNSNFNTYTIPSTVRFKFSSDVDLSTVSGADFAIVTAGGTNCSTMPTIGTVTNITAADAVDVAISGPVCTDGQSFAIKVLATTIGDSTKNGATGAAAPNMGPGADLSVGQFYYDSPGVVADVGVGATSANGLYAIGGNLTIVVRFDKAVTVTGSPQLYLDLTLRRIATYSSGSGTTDLVFTYTAQTDDDAADLNYFSTRSLILNGGTIVRTGTNEVINAELTLPALSGPNSLAGNRAIVVDGYAPRVSSHSPTGANNQWGNTARSVSYTMNEEINVASIAVGDLSISAGTCAGVPTVTGVSLGGVGNKVITFNLSTNTCNQDETYTLNFNPANVLDYASNVGVGDIESILFTTELLKPTVSFSAPSDENINSTSTLTYTVTYGSATSISLVSGNISFAGASAGCLASVSGTGNSRRTVSITGCSGNGTVQISLAANTALNVYGNSANAVAEASIVDFNADNIALTNPTHDLDTLGINYIYHLNSMTVFRLTFAGDIIGTAAELDSSISLNCDAGGGSNPVGVSVTRTSDTVATINPVESSPDFIYGATCILSGTNVPDDANNVFNMANITFKVARTPRKVSHTSGVFSHAAATAAGNIGNIVFNNAMALATVIPANVTLICDAQIVTITSLTPSVGDTTFTINVNTADPDWTSLVDGDTCSVFISTAITDSLGANLTTSYSYNRGVDP